MIEDAELQNFLSLENFQLAFVRLLSSLRLEVKDRLGNTVYGTQTDKHLQILIDDLTHEDFIPQKPEDIYLPKKDGTLRHEVFLSIDDRLVYQALGNIIIQSSYRDVMQLADRVSFAHIPTPPENQDRFVFRPTFNLRNRGIIRKGQWNKFRDRILWQANKFSDDYENPWLIRTDIISFYPSIDHTKLLEILVNRGWLTHPDLLNLLRDCLKAWTISPYTQGIPIGYETSDHLANLYLLSLDEQMSHHTLFRYVDDIYVCSPTRSEAKSVLNEFDLHLRSLSLKRNAVKTELIRLNDTTKSKLEEKLRTDLSALREEKPDGLPEKERQLRLREKFYEYYDSEVDCDDDVSNGCSKAKLRNPGVIAFVLNRLRIRDNLIRNIALCMLDYYPVYSFQAVTYLTRNYDKDDVVADKLWAVVLSTYEPMKVRLDCLEALKKMRGFIQVEEYVKWCFEPERNEEWYFRYVILDWFPHDPVHIDFFREVAQHDLNPHVRNKALRLWYKIEQDGDGKADIINHALSYDDLFSKKLGIYFWQRRIVVDQQRFQFDQNIPTKLLNLILSHEQLVELDKLNRNIKRIFGIEINPRFPIQVIFEEPVTVNQHLANVIESANYEMSDYVESSYHITTSLLNAFARIRLRNQNYRASELEGLVHNHFHDDNIVVDKTEELRKCYKQLLEQRYVNPNKRPNLKDEQTILFQYCFRKLHEICLGVSMRDEVFICYSHKDTKWRDKIQTALKPYCRNKNITVWVDTKIKAGIDWDDEIKKALGRAKVAVLLVSIDFLASDYIYNNELPSIFSASEHEGLVIVWIPVGPSAYGTIPQLAKLQCVHDPAKPLSSYSKKADQDRIMDKIARFVADQF